MIQTQITKKQKEILSLLYTFRFLNRKHIQTIFNHKTYTRINRWLKDLTEKNYTGRIFKRSWTENSVPSRYYLDKAGIRYLRSLPDIHKPDLIKLYKDKKRSPEFIDRCLFIADMYLQFLKLPRDNNTTHEFFTQSDFAPNTLMRDLKPDFVIRTAKRNKESYLVYQLILEGMPRFTAFKRMEYIVQFFTEEEGMGIPASLYFIIQPQRHYKYLTRQLNRLLQDESITTPVYLATYRQAAESGVHKSTFTKFPSL